MSNKKSTRKKKTAKKKTKQGSSNSLPPESMPSLKSMEHFLADLGAMGRGKRSAVDEAQEIMYDAWEATVGALFEDATAHRGPDD